MAKDCISRAFIRDGDLYLLDEPNSALDSISEKIILKSFKSLVRDKNRWRYLERYRQ